MYNIGSCETLFLPGLSSQSLGELKGKEGNKDLNSKLNDLNEKKDI